MGIAAGGVWRCRATMAPPSVAWAVTTVVASFPWPGRFVTGLIRREPGVDLIALLAMVGALALQEYLAGAVIALMLVHGRGAGGRTRTGAPTASCPPSWSGRPAP